MARLLTSHDPGHLHAILGCLALLHFAWRLYWIFTQGDAFPFSHTSTSWLLGDIMGVLLHGALPLVSLLLPLPKKRNFQNPMIWPEFRLHSIIFASRHVLATVYWLVYNYYKTKKQQQQSSSSSIVIYDGLLSMNAMSILTMMALVHATLVAASTVSEHFGDHKQRTTNAMPYDKIVPQEEIKRAKIFYAWAQFMATCYLFAGNPTISWIPLTGIQSAPFLMTLVRKGKCAAVTYHFGYAWSLIVPGIVFRHVTLQYSPQDHDVHTRFIVGSNIAFGMGAMAFILRMTWRVPKHLVWTMTPLMAAFVARYQPEMVMTMLSSPMVRPAIILTCFGVQNLILPHILFRPTQSTPLFIIDYGMALLMIYYFMMLLRRFLSYYNIYETSSSIEGQQHYPIATTEVM